MKQHIFPAAALTILCFLLLAVCYPVLIWGIARATPAKGKGEAVFVANRKRGYAREGQLFNQDKYFWSRPSAVNYDAAGSGGSNKAPGNPGYLKTVENRVDSFLAHNPGLTRQQIPSVLVTASGSGLDPDISPEAAYVQVKRIAAVRDLTETQIKSLVDHSIQKPFLNLFGTSRINVLELNIGLDKLSGEK